MFLSIIILISCMSTARSQNAPGVCYCVPTGTCNNGTGGSGTGIDNPFFVLRQNKSSLINHQILLSILMLFFKV